MRCRHVTPPSRGPAQDLCALVRESPPQLIVRAKLPPEVALEVLEAVLSSNVALFRDSALFRALLQCEVRISPRC